MVLHVLKFARPCHGDKVWGNSVLVGEGWELEGGGEGGGGVGEGDRLTPRESVQICDPALRTRARITPFKTIR